MGDANDSRYSSPTPLKIESKGTDQLMKDSGNGAPSSPYKASLAPPKTVIAPKRVDAIKFSPRDLGTPTGPISSSDEFRYSKRLVSGSSSQPILRKSKKDILEDSESESSGLFRVPFRSHIWREMLGGMKDCSQETMPWWASRQAYVTNFFNVPLKLEQFLAYGLVICIDSFLFIFAFLPIRTVLAIVNLLGSLIMPKRFRLTASQRFDLCRCSIFFLSYFLLNTLDGSYLYHFIRGQASLKLYVIFNLIEIFDKLCCSFGQDIFDYLFSTLLPRSNSTNTSNSSHSSTSAISLSSTGAFLAAFIYNSLHSLLLFVKVVTLNVSVNAYNNSLFTLLVSANFVELKGIVFKSFKTENVFQIACSDAVERFQILVFLSIVCVHNLNDLSWQLTQDTVWNIVHIVGIVVLMELIVDWLKHAFITRFNKMQSSIFHHFSRIIAIGVIQQDDIPDACYTTSKRIGFVSLPLACVVFRVFIGVAPVSGLFGFLWIFALWATLVATKFLMSLFILSMSVGIVAHSSPLVKTEKLVNTYAYDKVE